MTIANGIATFFAFVTLFLLIGAWALNTRAEAKMRLGLVVIALVTTSAAVGAWAGGHWHP
jgi:hypothetical protein